MISQLAVIFAAGFTMVFAQGFQSRNVNTGQFGYAALTSFAIGFAQVLMLSKVLKPGAGFVEILTYCLSGPAGVTASMWVHRHLMSKKARR